MRPSEAVPQKTCAARRKVSFASTTAPFVAVVGVTDGPGVAVFTGCPVVPPRVAVGSGFAPFPFVWRATLTLCTVRAASIECVKNPATSPPIIHRLTTAKMIDRMRMFHLFFIWLVTNRLIASPRQLLMSESGKRTVLPSRPVGTGGGCRVGRGPCACPRRRKIRWDFVARTGRSRTRTGTRPPHPFHLSPCPYRTEAAFSVFPRFCYQCSFTPPIYALASL